MATKLEPKTIPALKPKVQAPAGKGRAVPKGKPLSGLEKELQKMQDLAMDNGQL